MNHETRVLQKPREIAGRHVLSPARGGPNDKAGRFSTESNRCVWRGPSCSGLMLPARSWRPGPWATRTAASGDRDDVSREIGRIGLQWSILCTCCATATIGRRTTQRGLSRIFSRRSPPAGICPPLALQRGWLSQSLLGRRFRAAARQNGAGWCALARRRNPGVTSAGHAQSYVLFSSLAARGAQVQPIRPSTLFRRKTRGLNGRQARWDGLGLRAQPPSAPMTT